MRFILATVLALFVSQIGLSQAHIETIEPRDCKLFTALAATANKNSDDTTGAVLGRPMALSRMGRLSIQISWTGITAPGTADGALKVQVASTANVPASGDWIDKGSATASIATASGTALITFTNNTEAWARLVYTKNTITGGSITATCHAKSI